MPIMYPISASNIKQIAYWFNDSSATYRPAWSGSKESFNKNSYYPVTIIGGGYAGLSTLLHLVQNKHIDRLGFAGRPLAILLDEKQIGNGPSGNSGGHICWMQANKKQMIRACGRRLTERISGHMNGATDLIERITTKHDISCDLVRCYAEFSNGHWEVTTGGRLGWLAPYPFVVGLATACQETRLAKIQEQTLVTDIEEVGRLCRITTNRGSFWTSYIVAAGGHRMSETIPLLQVQRKQTIEIYVSTILIRGIAKKLFDRFLPKALLELAINYGHFPFADGSPKNVIYGVVDYRHGSIMFGSRDTINGKEPDVNLMLRDLFTIFPRFEKIFYNHLLSYTTLVNAMPVSVPINQMPIVTRNGNILTMQGLAGHGLAVGVLLGKAAAKKILSIARRDPDLGKTFDEFSAVPHLKLSPLSHPTIRKLASYAGRELYRYGLI
ncbi:MAG: FAD-binding oxidoreductase [Rhodospirillaceae bacterium]